MFQVCTWRRSAYPPVTNARTRFSVAAERVVDVHAAAAGPGPATSGVKSKPLTASPRYAGSVTPVAGLEVRGARLGVLARDPADLHHRHRGGVGEHHRHLQQHPQLVADVVGGHARRTSRRSRRPAAGTPRPRATAAILALRSSHSPAKTSGGAVRSRATAASTAARSGYDGCCCAPRACRSTRLGNCWEEVSGRALLTQQAYAGGRLPSRLTGHPRSRRSPPVPARHRRWVSRLPAVRRVRAHSTIPPSSSAPAIRATAPVLSLAPGPRTHQERTGQRAQQRHRGGRPPSSRRLAPRSRHASGSPASTPAAPPPRPVSRRRPAPRRTPRR